VLLDSGSVRLGLPVRPGRVCCPGLRVSDVDPVRGPGTRGAGQRARRPGARPARSPGRSLPWLGHSVLLPGPCRASDGVPGHGTPVAPSNTPIATRAAPEQYSASQPHRVAVRGGSLTSAFLRGTPTGVTHWPLLSSDRKGPIDWRVPGRPGGWAVLVSRPVRLSPQPPLLPQPLRQAVRNGSPLFRSAR
jgi:hypothetical protein